MAACGIDLILNAEVSGTTSTHIGSARIITGSNTYASFRGMFGPSSVATASIEIKRFTGATSITTLSASGIGLQDISGSGETLSAFGIVNDWYDFYASGSGVSVSSLIKGIKVTLY
tara:strand:+ start:2036 stop:2383 length:348 start_codon:yes stop_codon:yes gene_type:complete